MLHTHADFIIKSDISIGNVIYKSSLPINIADIYISTPIIFTMSDISVGNSIYK
jgi:hypothetical protein